MECQEKLFPSLTLVPSSNVQPFDPFVAKMYTPIITATKSSYINISFYFFFFMNHLITESGEDTEGPAHSEGTEKNGGRSPRSWGKPGCPHRL